MGPVIGEILPFALAVAISPVPIIAVILMLLAPRAGATSVGFLAGWVLGVTVAMVVFVVLTASTGLGGGGSGPSVAVSWIKLVLGIAVTGLGIRQWRTRPQAGEAAALPTWMAAIDTFTPGKALGLAFVLAAVNPKNLMMAVAAGTTIGGAALSTGGVIACIAVFLVVACSTVAVPVLGYAFAAQRMRRPLGELKAWLEHNNATVMAALLTVIGVVLFGKGLGGLT